MTIDSSELGKLGENIASRYLVRKGYKVVERNHRTRWGELDIVAVSLEKVLVFVEVKTVSGPNPQITPENQMTSSKLTKFRRAAELYANGNGQHLVSEKGYQVDLVAVVIENNDAIIKHYENV